MKKTLSLFVFCLFTLPGWCQEVLDNNPPSIKWSQVNTSHFRVIFPRGFDDQAMRVASTLEGIHDQESKSLGSKPRKISIILQNQSSVSNGFVSFLPRRSEFYTMPSQNYNFTGTNDWLNLLVSHEYRHVVQYQHAIRGFNKAFYYLFGGVAAAAMAQVAAPDWFWEGDAVATETAFTPSGRGKIPAFSRVFRTNLMEGRTFNYHKQYLRSYKHNIPDHYVLGYHLVSYLRKRTNDPDIWGKISADAWNVPFIPFRFSSSIKRETGMTVTQLYRAMADDLKKNWQSEIDQLSPTAFVTTPVERKKAYTDFLYPQPLDDGSILVLKRGLGNIEQFVLLRGGNDENVFTPGLMNDTGMISASGSLVVWNEFGFDPRWNVRNYSLIKAYDWNEKKKYVIGGKKTRYASASISPDHKKIVTVRTGTDYKTEVLVLSFPQGEIQTTFVNTRNDFYSMPKWSDDGSVVIALKTAAGMRSVVTLDPSTGNETEIIKPSKENIGYPVLYKGMLLYNSPASGVDNVYAYDLSKGTRYQITKSKYGAYNPAVSVDGTTIFYNEQTKDGLDVVRVPYDAASWELLTEPVSLNETSYAFLIEQEGSPELVQHVPVNNLPVTSYSKSANILNPYGWGVFTSDDLTEAIIGISTQNLLSTIKMKAGYVYNISERASGARAAVSYQGLYPIIDITATYANRNVVEVAGGSIRFTWLEKTIEAGLRLPLVTTSSKFVSNVSLGNKAGLKSVSDFNNNYGSGRVIGDYFFQEYADDGKLYFNHASFDAYQLLKRSRRDINSRWGQRLLIEHFSTPFGGNFNGQLLAATGIVYLPGLWRHHSLWGYGAFQSTMIRQTGNDYLFQNQIPVPRGLSVGRYENFYTASANYTMPVWYPDISIGPVLNVQRIRANGFFDYGFGRNQIFNLTGPDQVSLQGIYYASVGVEAKVDLNIFRFLPQIDIGVRVSQGIKPVTYRIDVLIGTFNF